MWDTRGSASRTCPSRKAPRSPNLIAYLIAAVTFIVGVLSVIGLPALAIVLVKFIKFKERELALEMESRQKSQHQQLDIEQRQLATEQRVKRIEEVLTSLDHDVRVRLGIDQTATPPPSHPELFEASAASDTLAREIAGPVLNKVR